MWATLQQAVGEGDVQPVQGTASMNAGVPGPAISSLPPPADVSHTAHKLRCAAPLEVGNGVDMLDLVCTSYATPPEELEGVDREAEDAPEEYDFSEALCKGRVPEGGTGSWCLPTLTDKASSRSP